MKRAFTMIELIFVIVILGILAAVAIPKLMATRTDAQAAKDGQNIANAIQEVSTYYTSQGKYEDNLSKMSSIIAQYESAGQAVINTTQKSADIKGCIKLQLVDNNGEVNLTVTHDNNTTALCQGIQSIVKPNTYQLAGSKVNFGG